MPGFRKPPRALPFPYNLLCLVCLCAFVSRCYSLWLGKLGKADVDMMVCGGCFHWPVYSSGGPARSALGQSLIHMHTHRPDSHTGQTLNRHLVSQHTSAKLTLRTYGIIPVGFYILYSQALPLELGQSRLLMFNPGTTP